MSKQKNQVSDLLAAIKRQPTLSKVDNAEAEAQAQESVSLTPLPQSVKVPRKREKPAKGKNGKAVQFWMHDQDRKLVRELSAWLAGQGVRPSDSMVIRAVLRLAKTGDGLLEAYRESAKLDGRLNKD